MKSIVYIIFVGFCTWLIIEPKPEVSSIDLPDPKLEIQTTNSGFKSDHLDTTILNIEKNLNYFKNAQID